MQHFLAGLRKIETFDGKIKQEFGNQVMFLIISRINILHPTFVIDISDVIDTKIEAIKAFKTQFFSSGLDDNEPQTYISTPEFLESVINRSKMYGKMIGVKHAEGFISKKMIGMNSFDSLIQKIT